MYLDQAARFLQNLGFSKLKAESILRNTEPCTYEGNQRTGFGGKEVYSKMDLLENVVAELVSRTTELKDDLDAANQKIRDLENK
jgi:hypothetical protein